MAKKYNKNTSKVHPITIVSIVVFVAALVLTMVLLQPSSSERFYNTYQSTAVSANSWDTYKYPEKGSAIKQSNAKEIINKIKAGELVVVYFSNPTHAVGANVIQDVNARLIGNKNPELDEASPSRNAHALYNEKLVTVIYHVTIKDDNHFKSVIDSINEVLAENTKHASNTTYPTLLAVNDSKVVAEQSFTSVSQALAVSQFYDKALKAVK